MKIEILTKSEEKPLRDFNYGDVVQYEADICLVCYGYSKGRRGLVSLMDPERTWFGAGDDIKVKYIGKLSVMP